MSAPAPSVGAKKASNKDKKRKTAGERKQLAMIKASKRGDGEGSGSDSSSSGSDSDSSDSSDSDSDSEVEVEVSGEAKKEKPKKPAKTPQVHLKNIPMLLITCDSGKEQLCKKEMLAWLIDYADRHYPRAAPKAAEATQPAASVSSGLAAELAALKAEAAAANSTSSASADTAKALGVRFKLMGDMMSMLRGMILIALLDETIPMVEMVEGMLDELRETKEFRTRHSIHLHPFAKTCYSEMDSLFKMAREIIPREFQDIYKQQQALPAEERKNKYCIELIRRGHHSLMDRDKIIQHVAQLVPTNFDENTSSTSAAAAPTDSTAASTATPYFTVNIKNPDFVILVEILGRTTGLSVFRQYAHYGKFNIRTIFEQVTGTKQEDIKKTPEEMAQAQRARNERKRKAEENRQKNAQAHAEKKLKQATGDAVNKTSEGEAVAEETPTTTE